ncbi:stimulated by retinoic acid gene 6 protein-like isoform X2 [Ptychodera flava]|uniref:stimulated by retinoic acid gene 6 protein-like isoform X2 n=1 Tax=Ptychodera flava TaxID=63121 RepID=UPI003969E098
MASTASPATEYFCGNVTDVILNVLPDGYESLSEDELEAYLKDNYDVTEQTQDYLRSCWEYIDQNLLSENIIIILEKYLFSPINLLDEYSDRIGFTAAFGISLISIIDLFIGNYYFVIDVGDVPFWAQGAVDTAMQIVNVLMICYVYAPFFACLSTPQRLLGDVLGLLYCSFWTTYFQFSIIECPVSNGLEALLYVLLGLPQLVCFYILAIRYIWGIVRYIRRRREKRKIAEGQEGKQDTVESKSHRWFIQSTSHDTIYVKSLFKKPEPPPEKITWKMKFRNLFYESIPGFKYSRRMVCTTVIGLLLLYEVDVGYRLTLEYVFANASHLFRDGGEVEEFFDVINASVTFYHAQRFVYTLSITFSVSSGVALVISNIYVLHMIVVYRRNMRRLYRGDRSFWPEKVVIGPGLMVNTFKWSGYQLAYTLWGYFLTQLTLWFALMVIVYGLIYAWVDDRTDSSIIWYLIGEYWLSVVFAIVITVVQILETKYFYLQDGGRSLAVNNRRAYHVTTYVMFYFNIILGLWSCLLRVLYSVIFGLLFLGRTDKCLLIHGWESLDSGHKAYLGFLQVEEQHTHPVMVIFADILLNFLHDKKSSDLDQDSPVIVTTKGDSAASPSSAKKIETDTDKDHETRKLMDEDTQKSKRSRIRWFVLYTLINNPILLADRKHARQPGEDKNTRLRKRFLLMMRDTVDLVATNAVAIIAD